MYDVIVIGAGISGLGAARVLTRENYQVLVLEARNRPGGRIHSVQLPPLESLYPTSPTSEPVNHDRLSVFHLANSSTTRFTQDANNPSEYADSGTAVTTPMDSSVTTSGTTSPATPTTLPGLEPGETVDVDLGANYLIGCSNRQADQPLFHMARLLGVPTATCAGDLCKKYRGWECAELANWRNHLLPGSPAITIEEVAEAVFLFDKVIHLAVHNHLKLKSKLSKARKQFESSNLNTIPTLNEPTVKQFIDGALDAILKSEARFGLRPEATFRNPTEKGIFDSVIARYLAYVNPLDRLPHSVLDELCEVANPRWHLNLNGTQAAQALGIPLELKPPARFSLADQLALAYPSVEQREAYRVWAGRKLSALESDQAGSVPEVVRSVHVSWEDRLVTGRFADLLQPLIQNVPVVYNTTVTLIDWLGDPKSGVGVRITTRPSCGDDRKQVETTYEAKYCIVTVPVGVLKGLDSRSAITFQPPLPQEKREAIGRLAFPAKGAATHEKVILRFRSPEDVFWDTKAAHLKCPDPRLHILNLHRYGKPGVLCAHLWGGSGLSPSGMSDQAVVDLILDLLDQMYPEVRRSTVTSKRGIPDPVQYVVTRWSEDPYALGAYTTGEPGSSDADRLCYAATLFEQDAYRLANTETDENADHQPSVLNHATSTTPVPRLLFAGEGTLTASEAKECTHGALQTGVLRAIELLPFLSDRTSGELLSTAEHRNKPFTEKIIPLNKLAHYLVGKSKSQTKAPNTIAPSDRRTRSIRRPTRHILDEMLDFGSGRRGSTGPHLVQRAHSASDIPMVVGSSDSSPSSSSDYDDCDISESSSRSNSASKRYSASELSVFTGRRPTRGGFVNACRANDVTTTVHAVSRSTVRGSVYTRGKPKAYRNGGYVRPSRTTRSDLHSSYLVTRRESASSALAQANSRRKLFRPLVHIRKIRESWPLLSVRGRARTLAQLTDLLDDLRAETEFPDATADPVHKSPFALSPFANCTVQLKYHAGHSTKLKPTE